MKKIVPLSVSVKKRKVKAVQNRSGKNNFIYYERTINGFKEPIKQKVLFKRTKSPFSSTTKKIELRLTTQKGVVGKLSAEIYSGGESFAAINWVSVNEGYKKSGLATQMLSETLDILKKAGVKTVSAQIIQGHGIYKKLGFQSKSKFGETWVWKKLN